MSYARIGLRCEFNDQIMSLPMSDDEFKSIVDSVQATGRAVTGETRRRVEDYYDAKTKEMHRDDPPGGWTGVRKLFAFGPSCWNAGIPRVNHAKLICVMCGRRHA